MLYFLNQSKSFSVTRYYNKSSLLAIHYFVEFSNMLILICLYSWYNRIQDRLLWFSFPSSHIISICFRIGISWMCEQWKDSWLSNQAHYRYVLFWSIFNYWPCMILPRPGQFHKKLPIMAWFFCEEYVCQEKTTPQKNTFSAIFFSPSGTLFRKI